MGSISALIEGKMLDLWEETGAGHYRARMNHRTRTEMVIQLNRERPSGWAKSSEIVVINNRVGLVSFETDDRLPDGHVEVEALREDDDGEEISSEA